MVSDEMRRCREFQSTTSRGGRQYNDKRCLKDGAFQSTTSRGGRHHVKAAVLDAIDISIHDLPRRSTRVEQAMTCWMRHFNPRPPEEVDFWLILILDYSLIFQSTTSRGGRRAFRLRLEK